MGTEGNPNPPKMNFKSILQVDLPLGRSGKHQKIVNRLLSDLEQLEADRALKIPIEGLHEPMENVRSAITRAAHQKGMTIATFQPLRVPLHLEC